MGRTPRPSGTRRASTVRRANTPPYVSYNDPAKKRPNDAAALSRRYRVHAIDLPGFGEATHAAEIVRIPLMTRGVTRIQTQRVAIVGFGTGELVGDQQINAALQNPPQMCRGIGQPARIEDRPPFPTSGKHHPDP